MQWLELHYFFEQYFFDGGHYEQNWANNSAEGFVEGILWKLHLR
jgi:hypothetical protein